MRVCGNEGVGGGGWGCVLQCVGVREYMGGCDCGWVHVGVCGSVCVCV